MIWLDIVATSHAPEMSTQWAKRAVEIKGGRKIVESHRRNIINDLMHSMYATVYGIIRQRVCLKRLKVDKMTDCLKVLQALSKLSKEDTSLKDLIVSTFPASSASDLERASVLVEEHDDEDNDESSKESVRPMSHNLTPAEQKGEEEKQRT
ncbi:unnamed protein product [Rodentolepis nana]|uniref:CaMBD domain-containing protein n=1 Tax=Rodentolepis nana TaxID=102285 RepID=A0A0R3TZN0_RODNA|nr:unnamed protein product [Rodentolepis nana]